MAVVSKLCRSPDGETIPVVTYQLILKSKLDSLLLPLWKLRRNERPQPEQAKRHCGFMLLVESWRRMGMEDAWNRWGFLLYSRNTACRRQSWDKPTYLPVPQDCGGTPSKSPLCFCETHASEITAILLENWRRRLRISVWKTCLQKGSNAGKCDRSRGSPAGFQQARALRFTARLCPYLRQILSGKIQPFGRCMVFPAACKAQRPAGQDTCTRSLFRRQRGAEHRQELLACGSRGVCSSDTTALSP